MTWYSYNPFSDWPQFGQGNTNAAMGGPLYRFNEDLVSEVKLPKEMDNSLLIFDWGRSFIKYMKMDDNGRPLSVHPFKDGALNEMELEFDKDGKFLRAFMAPSPMQQPMDLKIGPEGALYVLSWGEWNYPHNTSIGTLIRIEHGNPITGIADRSFYTRRTFHENRLIAHFGSAQTLDLPEGVKGLDLFDVRGNQVWTYRRAGTLSRITLSLPASVPKGMLKARILR